MNKVEIALSKMLMSTDPAIVADACAVRCLKLVMTDKVDTAATDGIVLLVNPEFAEKQTIDQLMGLLVHEVCHVRFLHTERFVSGGWLDHGRANKSMDREINPIVRDAGYQLPDGGCWPDEIGCVEGLAWEEYYAKEQDEPQGDKSQEGQQGQGQAGEQDGDGQGEGEGGQSQPIEAGVHAPGQLAKEFAPELLQAGEEEGQSVEEVAREVAREVAAQIRDVTEQSRIEMPEQSSGKKAGSGTAANQLQAREVVETDCHWHETVIGLVASRARGESVADWSRPHRRSISTGGFRPSRRKVSGFRLALVLDVSGSCVRHFSAWQAMARELVEEVTEITELELLYHDDVVTGHEVWSRRDGEEVTLLTKGGGGTSFGPVLAEVEKLDVDGAILFTDAEGCWPKSCSVDCITVQPPNSGQLPPFGKVVRINAWR